ncbi:Peptidyl-prolyl cis-trans isomerase Pin1 [Dendrobium catenatum]|uniref:Peptidyl-prolyl cis-trans isomerase n=1 Tax=Dendrobium catenatum TaxID=906689 RepID=A0A2I0WGH2_9ASPA|nr:Peptidyl-prolyl cis-trans isomerase Pin1 [Dendrobium catenatum]
MGKDSKPKESAKKGKGKQPSSGEEEKTSKGKGKGGKSGDDLGTCTYVKARHILCEKQGQINEAYKKLQEGWLSNGDKVPPAEFAKVAAEYSECPSGKKGGDLGWFPRGKMAGPFQEVAFGTPVGATTAPFKSTMRGARMDISEELLELLEISTELKALRQRKRILLERRR